MIGEIQSITQVDLGTYRHLYRQFLGTPEGKAGKGETHPEAEPEWDNDEADPYRAVTMDELHRMQMWNLMTKRSSGDHYYLSALPSRFVTVCRRPAKRA